MQSLMSAPWSFETCQEAQRLCARLGWPFQEIQHNRVYVALARTPGGMVFSIMPRDHAIPAPHQVRTGYHHAGFDVGAAWDIGMEDEVPWEEDHRLWEEDLASPTSCALWGSLLEGCTPVMKAGVSRHESLALRKSWLDAQQGVPGWSGQAVVLPPDVVVEGDGVLLALRQGRFIVILETRPGGMDSLVARDPDLAWPRMRAVGMYVRDHA